MVIRISTFIQDFDRLTVWNSVLSTWGKIRVQLLRHFIQTQMLLITVLYKEHLVTLYHNKLKLFLQTFLFAFLFLLCLIIFVSLFRGLEVLNFFQNQESATKVVSSVCIMRRQLLFQCLKLNIVISRLFLSFK